MSLPPAAIATQFKSGPEHAEIARKGGLVRSEKKSLATRIRNLKRTKAISAEKAQYLTDMMMDGELANFYVLKFVTDVLEERRKSNKPLNVYEANLVARLNMDWVKMQHGSREFNHKVDVTATVVNVKFDVPQEFSPPKLEIVTVPTVPCIGGTAPGTV